MNLDDYLMGSVRLQIFFWLTLFYPQISQIDADKMVGNFPLMIVRVYLPDSKVPEVLGLIRDHLCRFVVPKNFAFLSDISASVVKIFFHNEIW